jgi:hypothetical protein
MSLENAVVGELLLANAALEWSFSRVHAEVPLPMLAIDKPFAACFAGKWLLPCMGHHVLPEFAL